MSLQNYLGKITEIYEPCVILLQVYWWDFPKVLELVIRLHNNIYFFLNPSGKFTFLKAYFPLLFLNTASFPVLYNCWQWVYPYLITSNMRWRRFLTVQDSLVSLKKISWMVYEVNSKDNRKNSRYQVFLKTAKNSVSQ